VRRLVSGVRCQVVGLAALVSKQVRGEDRRWRKGRCGHVDLGGLSLVFGFQMYAPEQHLLLDVGARCGRM